MYDDPIVREIHQIREQLCQKFQFDIRQIFADVKQREQQHKDKLVKLPVKQGRSPNESLKLTQKGGR
jgi:hypothetical protein